MEAAESECKRSSDLSSDGIKERLAIALSRIEARAGREIARGTGLLATIGATAPFVGLFGTVWGIMNSFIGISHSKTTNLAVVAPGIAEALLATALGLVAAIPAVIIYNVFARALASYRALLSDASGEIIQHISRDLERQERGTGLVGGVAVARPLRCGVTAMAVSLKDPQDGGIDELSEINVTPFIDVMLVLLIIFMVAAPLSTVDIAVDLPVSNAQPQPRPDKPVFLTVKQDLTLALGNDDVPRNTLQATLDQQTEQ